METVQIFSVCNEQFFDNLHSLVFLNRIAISYHSFVETQYFSSVTVTILGKLGLSSKENIDKVVSEQSA